jgi:hypothetical protein
VLGISSHAEMSHDEIQGHVPVILANGLRGVAKPDVENHHNFIKS